MLYFTSILLPFYFHISETRDLKNHVFSKLYISQNDHIIRAIDAAWLSIVKVFWFISISKIFEKLFLVTFSIVYENMFYFPSFLRGGQDNGLMVRSKDQQVSTSNVRNHELMDWSIDEQWRVKS